MLLVLVGMPGAGKTHLARRLVARGNWRHVSQDELGSRRACEDECARALRQGWNVVVDRCNFDEQQRRHWVQIARSCRSGPALQLVAVQLLLPLDLCRQRARGRTDHPTLGPHNCDEVISRFAADFVHVRPAEGFHRVITVRSSPEAEAQVDALAVEVDVAAGGAAGAGGGMAWAPAYAGPQARAQAVGYGYHGGHDAYAPPPPPAQPAYGHYRAPPAPPPVSDVTAGFAGYYGGPPDVVVEAPVARRRPALNSVAGATHSGAGGGGGSGFNSGGDGGAGGGIWTGGGRGGGGQGQSAPHWGQGRGGYGGGGAYGGRADHGQRSCATAVGRADGAAVNGGLLAGGYSNGCSYDLNGSGLGSSGLANGHANGHEPGGPRGGGRSSEHSNGRGSGQGGRGRGAGGGAGGHAHSAHKAVEAQLRAQFANPSSSVCYDAAAHPGAAAPDPRPVLLFDLNGTLTSHTSVRHASGTTRLRPGAGELLRRLQPHFRLGIYTSSTLRTVNTALQLLEADAAAVAAADGMEAGGAAAGGGSGSAAAPPVFERALILHREHTAPAPKGHVAAGGDPWDTLKPLGRYFGRLHRVGLVDDDAYKAVPGESGNMLLLPCWRHEDPSCRVLQRLGDLLLQRLVGLPEDADVRHHLAAVSEQLRQEAAAEGGAQAEAQGQEEEEEEGQESGGSEEAAPSGPESGAGEEAGDGAEGERCGDGR